MNSAFIIANILGGLIFILNVLSNAKLTTKKVYIYNGLCNGLSIIQYVLLGAWTGALCCVIAVIRNIIFVLFKKDIPVIYLIIYLVIAIGLNIGFINGIVDIIPIINISIYAIALWTKKITNIKIIGIITCITGIIYDFMHGAYITVLNEIVDGIAGFVSLRIITKNNKSRTK